MTSAKKVDPLLQQFKDLANLFATVEDMVRQQGVMSQRELNVILESHKTSELGTEVINSFIAQSDKVKIVVDEKLGQMWLEPNPDYVPEHIDEEVTDIVVGRTPTKKL